jgi:hypothetical protein
MALAAAAAGWAFFHLPTEMHERYSVPAVGLMCLLPLWHSRWWALALAASITTMLNIVDVAPFYFPPWPALQEAVNWFIWPERQWTWTILAVIHLLMFMLLVEALWRLSRPDRDSAGDMAGTAGFPIKHRDATPARR